MRFTQQGLFLFGGPSLMQAVPRQFVLATAAERRTTLRVTTAVTSTGRAVDQALVRGGGRRSTAYPARVFLALTDGAAETVQNSIADRGSCPQHHASNRVAC
jgi:hypothetical protein